MVIKNKKAALELSMTTVIIIVLSVVFLILGLVLIRGIFTNATDSVSTINDQLKSEIKKMFSDETTNVVVYLGSDKTAKIKAGTTNFGIAVGAQTNFGTSISKRSDLEYSLELEPTSSCIKLNGNAIVQKWFAQKLSPSETNRIYNSIDEFQSSNGFARVQISIPEGTKICTQRAYITFKDNTDSTLSDADKIIGGSRFDIEVLQKGLFG